MFTNLSQFYTSDEWRSLRASLLFERQNNKGFVICEECGQPIIKGYDCIAHHEQPITLQNVNDYSISLNPENIKLLHTRCHNMRHARFGFTMQKKVYMVIGAPCSGKTTFVRENKGNSDLVIDIDMIWQAVSGGTMYEKPDALKAPVFAAYNALLDSVKTRAGKWERAWIITAEANKAARERKCREIGAEPIIIDTEKEICLQRLQENPNGRDIAQWTGFIEKYFSCA